MQPCPIKPKQTIVEAENSIKDLDANGEEIFGSKNDMKQSLYRLCYGDLYIIGRIWIQALKSVLIGTKVNLFPVVEAAEKEKGTPKRPPPMRYKDLPIYETPHYDYKTYIEDKRKCPEANVKLLHRLLLPYVKNSRKKTEQNLSDAKKTVISKYGSARSAFIKSKEDFKKSMRDPKKLALRQAVVAAGGIAGFFIGSGGGVPRRLFFTGMGLLSAGSLCFPKETDEAFRNFAYNTGKVGIAFYNRWCGKQFTLRERIPCKEDLPAIPPKRSQFPTKEQCPSKDAPKVPPKNAPKGAKTVPPKKL